jgi:azurin
LCLLCNRLQQLHLLSLPDSLAATDLVAAAHVDKAALVRFGTNLYSVPPRCAHGTVTLVASDAAIAMLDGANVVVARARNWENISASNSHVIALSCLSRNRLGGSPGTRDRLLAAVHGINALTKP